MHMTGGLEWYGSGNWVVQIIFCLIDDCRNLGKVKGFLFRMI